MRTGFVEGVAVTKPEYDASALVLRRDYRITPSLDGIMNASPVDDLNHPEKRLELIHRVIVPDRDYPKEYAIMVTDRRSIFIRQKKTRKSWVLRQEMRIGTALVTDVIPKTLEDYENTSIETLTADPENLTVPHEAVTSLEIRADPLEHRRRDFFIWTVMKLQKEIFQVYYFEIRYRQASGDSTLRFYAVPLGVYFKPRRQTQTRETILREYAADIMEMYRKLGLITPTDLVNHVNTGSNVDSHVSDISLPADRYIESKLD